MYRRFLKWAILFLERSYRAQHLKIHRNDMKCPCCEEWFSVSGIKHNHKFVDTPNDLIAVVCGQCKTQTYWSASIAPCLIRVDENGEPISHP